MNKPCEHCNMADKGKQGYFKCDNPCKQAKACYESDKKMVEILGGMFGGTMKKGGENNGI